ncbi:Protein kinase domain,Mad3/Bub1 homology region 1,Serine/threonine-protein kinase, active [Cinara cedri]|uniref:Protein kinase domain,Mad3/Bub1 homology region 1,Serine/threonine-protein kinase, active n=1 Tax=Cinara cedri TaxID=506608 RepID=A0A5E4NSH2_9HEMI|nr:Protein kinase domain,Mad3/Bub1 homology region 1,Serine/threonine-protein kinase, active [Cinara cedri]
MNAADTSDALDLTKENIKPLKQGRKPIQLETALQAQSNSEIQQKLNKSKDLFENAIRLYEGDDPLAPRLEYIKWLEQIYLKTGPQSNLMPLIEETVHKFKNDPKYKQDPRFVEILVNFIENQSNAVELFQTVYNQGLGTMCSLFYRAWADLLDRYNDFKRVDQIYLLGIKSKAQPLDELEQAHMQFQLSVARRLLNNDLTNEDKNPDLEKRQAFSVLKKIETHSGVRQGLGGAVGKKPQMNNNNDKAPSSVKVFEDNDENGLFGMEDNKFDLVASKSLNKENTIKPGPWTKPKKSHKVPKPVSTVNFEVHQDNNVECISKQSGITMPNALRNIKGCTTLSCPVAIFEEPDPSKRPMYCKDKVYAAGRDIQIEEIRYEIFLKHEAEKNLSKRKHPMKFPTKENVVKPSKKVVLQEGFKVPSRADLDPLSQSVTVNTRVAIDLVQQMWNSPCSDKDDKDLKLIPNNIKPIPFNEFEKENKEIQCSSDFMVYEDNKIPVKNITKVPKLIDHVKFSEECENKIDNTPIEENNKMPSSDFMVYEDNTSPIKNTNAELHSLVDHIKVSEVYVDENDKSPSEKDNEQMASSSDFLVYQDNKNPIQNAVAELPSLVDNIKVSEVYIDEEDNPSSEKVKKQMPSSSDFIVYEDNKTPIQNAVAELPSQIDHIKVSEVYVDGNDKMPFKIPKKCYGDENNSVKQTKEVVNDIHVYSNENKSPMQKVQNVNVNYDDITCSTKAFAFLLSSSTPLINGGSKSRNYTENKLQSLKLIEKEDDKELDELPLGKHLSMILEASKERNSNSSSGITSTNSITKLEQQSCINFGDYDNPFDEDFKTQLLKKVVQFPNEYHMSGYKVHESEVPSMRSEFKLDHNKMTFICELGKGSYARVIKARSDEKNSVEKAFKIQKPACVWEWYILKEIQHRLKDSEKISYFVNMDNIHVFKNGSIISMDYANYSTLLSVILAYKKKWNQSIPVTISSLFVSQVLSAVKYLHQCQIIHGDIKPDNVIVKSLPNTSFDTCIQLIDFGRSIDLSLYPPETTFTYTVKTADFICHEMREKLPWTYQTDYYGVAGIIYMCLMSDYMKTQKIRKVWVPLKPFPRYIDKSFWDPIISVLLNIKSCESLPNLDEIIDKLKKYISSQQKVVLNHNFISLKNALKNN